MTSSTECCEVFKIQVFEIRIYFKIHCMYFVFWLLTKCILYFKYIILCILYFNNNLGQTVWGGDLEAVNREFTVLCVNLSSEF